MRSSKIVGVLLCGLLGCSEEICEAACESNFIISMGDGSGTPLAGFSGSVVVDDTPVDLTCPSTSSATVTDQFGRTIRFECNRTQILGAIFPALSRPSDLQVVLDVRATGSSAAYAGDVVVDFELKEEICDRACYDGTTEVLLTTS